MKNRLGVFAWAGLASYVVLYDVLAVVNEAPTLSSTFYRATSMRVGRWFLLGFWLYLTGHLFRWTPAKYDAFRMLDRPLPAWARGRKRHF